MTPADLTLAQRLIACDRFRWLPGMRVLPDAANRAARCVRVDGACWVFAVEDDIQIEGHFGPAVECWSDDALTGEELPDLTDPATLGCLLALVREHYPGCHAEPNGMGEGSDEAERANWWCVYQAGGRLIPRSSGPTEAAALVTALENAP